MPTTYAQKQAPAQKMGASSAASVLDASSQSEGLQRKAEMANNAAQRAEATRPNNTGMPDNLKSGIESLSGFSMDDVRVHYNSSKPATVQALAYTQGTDIHVAPGQEKCLPHEAWHVAQQMAGRVSPTTNVNGMPVNDNAGLEHEADVMGAKATQMKSDESKTVQRATIWNGVAQRVELKDYYYHISGGKIDGDIKPKRAIQQGRTRDGDDLGPGFYMGDSIFLPYYYGENFLDDPEVKSVYIYYIEKKLIDDNLKSNIMDFTDKTETNKYSLDPDKLFEIAMELGFKDESGNIALDLLASEKTEAFKDMVTRKYGENSDESRFFEAAINKAIWKGYINDIYKGQKIATLEKIDIEKLTQKYTENVELRKELNDFLSKGFVYTSEDERDRKIRDDLGPGIRNILRKYNLSPGFPFCNFLGDYRNLLLTKSTVKVKRNYMKNETGVKPIQIAIRQDIGDAKDVKPADDAKEAKDAKPADDAKEAKDVKKVTLLEKIKSNEIPITKDEIESTRAELDAARTKSGTEGDTKNEGPKPEPLKPAETEPVTNGDAKNEGSKQELLKTAGTESATSKDLKSELNAAGTESNVSDDLKNEIKIAFAKEKEKRSQK